MTAAKLLSELRRQDVRLWSEGGRLRINAPKGALSSSLQAELTRRKSEILEYLGSGSAMPSGPPPLEPRPRDGMLPLSFGQERLWFLNRLDPESLAYNVSVEIHLKGPVDVPALERALAEVVRRHEVMRTTYTAVEGQPFQHVHPAQPVSLPVADLRGFPEERRREEARAIWERLAGYRFDLGAHAPWVASLLQLEPDHDVVLLTLHHILTDRWSLGLLLHELQTLYRCFREGQLSPLPGPRIQYGDFAGWQREWMQGEALATQLAYWKERLGGPLPVLALPTDRERPPIQSFRGACETLELPASLRDELATLARREGATPFMALLAGFLTLLHRYSGQGDILVGTPVAGRSQRELEGLLGFFVNTLVLRNDLSGEPSFRELLARVREVTLGAFAHQDLPFEKLVRELQPERSLAQNPLFRVMLVLQNVPAAVLGTDAMVLNASGGSTLDLTLYVVDHPQGLSLTFEYSTDLYDAATIKRMLAHLRNLLAGAAADPERRIWALPMLGEAERRQALFEWNAACLEPPWKDVTELFEEQVRRTPDAVAVADGREALTYGELKRRADDVARGLCLRGVGPEVKVGLLAERSVWMLAGMLGVLKAGGAYLPLDPTHPEERIRLMIEDSGAALVLSSGSLAQLASGSGVEVIELEACTGQGDTPGAACVRASNLAYVIYTSGSTGRPKGVGVTRRGLASFLLSMRDQIGVAGDDVLVALTTLSFDIAALELLLPLLVGARVVIVERDVAMDGSALAQVLDRSGATVLQATPSGWRLLLEAGWRAQPELTLLCGGEALTAELARELLDGAGALWNLYGPTEATIWSTAERVEAAGKDIASLGRPLANTRVYVLDRHLEPVPLGATGELYIGGAGVARGYLGRPDLTAERFVPDPFGAEPGGRLYRTGDLASHLPDGRLVFLGRADQQVKLRGHRIELEEIEANLGEHAGVGAAAVLLRQRSAEDAQLVAHVVLRPGADATVTELRSFLKGRLPSYMVPASFVFLDELPMTRNGKVDRNALQLHDVARGAGADRPVEPRTEMERLVAGIWREALGIERVGVHDNFFDLGGHSLLSMRVLARIEKQTGQPLHPRDIVFHTLEQLAAICEERTARAAGHAGSRAAAR